MNKCRTCDNYDDCSLSEPNEYCYRNTADVVEVVRCKDCKYRTKLTSEEDYGVEIWVCNHDCGCAQCNDDDFCRYGEKKETE